MYSTLCFNPFDLERPFNNQYFPLFVFLLMEAGGQGRFVMGVDV
jgi:hypothetical protein